MISDIARLRPGVVTRSISPENPTGAAGAGGRATEGTGATRPGPRAGLEGLAERRDRRAQTVDLADHRRAGRITHIWLTTHPDNWRSLLLRAHWDGADEPAIEVPVGDFFGQGWGEFAQLSSSMVAVNPHGGFNSYWPMPFRHGARLTLENLSDVTRPSCTTRSPTRPAATTSARRLPARAVAASPTRWPPGRAHARRRGQGHGPVRRHIPRVGQSTATAGGARAR